MDLGRPRSHIAWVDVENTPLLGQHQKLLSGITLAIYTSSSKRWFWEIYFEKFYATLSIFQPP